MDDWLNDSEAGATFSPCRQYRYSLWRRWKPGAPYALFIGLNPSTADETLDDPTIRRCKRFSRDWGYGAYVMANIFAYRATDPKEMKAQREPIGIDNNVVLQDLARGAGIIVCAWGTHGAYRDRGLQVIRLLDAHELYCLGRTKEGHPKHPLYIRADKQPEMFGAIP